mgnify:CR=1 FL=1
MAASPRSGAAVDHPETTLGTSSAFSRQSRYDAPSRVAAGGLLDVALVRLHEIDGRLCALRKHRAKPLSQVERCDPAQDLVAKGVAVMFVAGIGVLACVLHAGENPPAAEPAKTPSAPTKSK